jgi:hypothetical protein|tara:strand:+ start:165 stop:653 length:489 start_codon:yes stop_codon:yes gene_type:complete
MVQSIKAFFGKVVKFIKYSLLAGFVVSLALVLFVDTDKAVAEAVAFNKEYAEQQLVEQAEAVAKAEKIAAQAKAKRVAGFHCLSGWDGSHRQVAIAVEKSLRDPSSFDHRSTKIWPKSMDGNDTHTLLMTYSGKNGFGGTAVERVSAKISHSTCAVLSIEKV